MKNRSNHFDKPLFSFVHSCLETEWEGAPLLVSDDEETATARRQWEKRHSFEAAFKLAEALCYQLRYGESLRLIEPFQSERPDDYALNRRLGVLYFKLLQFDRSIEKLKICLAHTNEKLHILYLLGVVSYYRGAYDEAHGYLLKCLPLLKGNGEMHVAVLFWISCLLARTGKPQNELFELTGEYRIDAGHHTGYDAYLRTVLGLLTKEEAIERSRSDTELNRACLYYGLSVYFRSDEPKSRSYLEKTLSFKDYFGSFAYIAGYLDGKNI